MVVVMKHALCTALLCLVTLDWHPNWPLSGSFVCDGSSRNAGLVLSCLVSLECTLWEGFFWRMPKQAYTVPCRASHPRGQGAQVLCT